MTANTTTPTPRTSDVFHDAMFVAHPADFVRTHMERLERELADRTRELAESVKLCARLESELRAAYMDGGHP